MVPGEERLQLDYWQEQIHLEKNFKFEAIMFNTSTSGLNPLNDILP